MSGCVVVVASGLSDEPGEVGLLSIINRPVAVRYKNHRGEVEVRHIQALDLLWGSTDWHPEPQWLVRCWDYDRGAERLYAQADMDPSTIEVWKPE